MKHFFQGWWHPQPPETNPRTARKVLHSAFWYDLVVWAFTGGREHAFRDKTIDLARLGPGESVLDVGCGTGTLAMAAKRRAGDAGTVVGIDASPEMIARAERKARKAGVDVSFQIAAVESLPFRDGTFDAVLSTLVLHHLADEMRWQGLREMRRVLKRGGRLCVVDFGGEARGLRRWAAAGRRRHHRDFDLCAMISEVNQTGLRDVEVGALGFQRLHYIRAVAP